MELTFAIIRDALQKEKISFCGTVNKKIFSPEDAEKLVGIMTREERPVPELEAVSILMHVFTVFSDWENAMLRRIVRQCSLQELMDMAASMLDNPIALMDANLMILYRSSGAPEIQTGTVWDIMQGNYLVPGNFYDPSEIRHFSEKIRKQPGHSLCYSVRRDPGHTYYAASFSVAGRVVGTIGSVSLRAPITEGQQDILDRVRGFAELYFERQKMHTTTSGITSVVLRQLISSQKCGREVLMEELQRYHMEENGEFLILTFVCPVPFYSELEMNSFINLVHFQLSRAVLAIFREQIVAAFRKEDYPVEEKKYRCMLEKFLADHEISAGCSRVFYHWNEADSAYEQSAYAVSQALKKKTPLVLYRDVASEHVIDCLESRKKLRTFCRPELLRLAENGKERKEALIPCLTAYLMNGRSLSDTSRALGLHRNTVVYRIQKLERLLHVDFHAMEEEDVLSYLLTCEILMKKGQR